MTGNSGCVLQLTKEIYLIHSFCLVLDLSGLGSSEVLTRSWGNGNFL